MKLLGIIPARYDSTRFPGKPLINLNGTTMIERVYEGVKKSEKITEIVVATDDERIYSEVKRFGGNVVMTSKLHVSGTDRCGEVAALYPEMDIIINIQGDEPLVDYRQIDQLASAFENQSIEIATLVIKQLTKEDIVNPTRIKIVVNSKQKALYFSRSPIPNNTHCSGSPLENYPYLRHIGLYAYRASVLKKLINLTPTALEKIESLEQLRWLYHGYDIQVIETDIETPNIDSPEDVAAVISSLNQKRNI